MAAATPPVPSGFVVRDFAEYLKGTWKRNTEWRHFGGSFEHIRSNSSVVKVDEVPCAQASDGVRILSWSFGSALSNLRLGYNMTFVPDTQGTFMKWEYGGNNCTGSYQPGRNLAVLNFYLPSSTITITYRAMDVDTMAVCIVEVDDRHTPTIQYGNMCRINAHRYPAGAGAAKPDDD